MSSVRCLIRSRNPTPHRLAGPHASDGEHPEPPPSATSLHSYALHPTPPLARPPRVLRPRLLHWSMPGPGMAARSSSGPCTTARGKALGGARQGRACPHATRPRAEARDEAGRSSHVPVMEPAPATLSPLSYPLRCALSPCPSWDAPVCQNPGDRVAPDLWRIFSSGMTPSLNVSQPNRGRGGICHLGWSHPRNQTPLKGTEVSGTLVTLIAHM